MTWARGSTRASRNLRAAILQRDPVCRCPGCPKCTPHGCARPSVHDDHIVNLAEGGTDDPSNHAGKCAPCHDHKTQQEAARGRGRHARRRPTETHPAYR